MVPHLMGTRRWDEGHQAFDELVSLHEDVGGAVPPAALEAQRERSIGALFESLARERWSGDVAAEPLEAAASARM